MPGDCTSHYDYTLPAELIAQTPPATRGDSRLMIVERCGGRITHARFADLPGLVPPHDLLVRNTTRVTRARLLGTRDSGAPAEILLLQALGDFRYEAMVRPGGKMKPGRRVHVGDELDVEVLEITERRTRIVRLVTPLTPEAAIERYGHVPLPPYIQRADVAADTERYQTVYATQSGSAAAPTAGLHFTQAVLDALLARRVVVADVLLHVGAGTFKPVEVDDPALHEMHEEWFDLPAATADALNAARARSGSVWAVGTTTVRTLESAAAPDGSFAAQSGDTRIFIRPPFTFRAVDHMLTNFHLPRSTLLMLVAAFAGYELTMQAYRTAIAEGYRFYSYGDAMVIV